MTYYILYIYIGSITIAASTTTLVLRHNYNKINVLDHCSKYSIQMVCNTKKEIKIDAIFAICIVNLF